MEDIRARTAFVTGGAQGIGLGIARAFAEAGAKLALADIDEAALVAAKHDLSDRTAVETFVLDVRDRDSYAQVADDAERRLGPVSLLFNNAGVASRVPVTQMSFATWDWALGINLGGAVNGIQTFVPRMIDRMDGGHIVNTASAAGLAMTGKGGGAGFLYHTAKYGVVGMSESLRGELEELHIGVSVLCPGPVATNLLDTTAVTRPANSPLPAKESIERTRAVLAGGASPDEVGKMVLDAVRGNRLFIHTDRVMVDSVKARTAEILDAMPPEP